jgi:hypothetical protein
MPPQEHKSKMWILYSFSGMVCLLLTNFLLSTIGNKSGPFLLSYFATGEAFAGLIYNIWDFYNHFKETGKLWSPQNIIIKGKMNWRNLVAFVLFCITFFMV